jgi:lactoylglutathione lyase
MSISLHSFAIFVTDIERARVFYEEQLGLPVSRKGSFGFELLDQEPHLGVHPARHPDALKLVGRHTGITFHVPDLLTFCSRLGELGVPFVNEPTQQGFGIMALIADPDGNIMALWDDHIATEAPAP